MKKTTLFFLLIYFSISIFGQTTPLTESPINFISVPKTTFLGEFSGFNDGPFCYSQNFGINVSTNSGCSGCDGLVNTTFYDINNILKPSHRFPGGTVANNYHRYYSNMGNDFNGGAYIGKIYNNPNFIVNNSIYSTYDAVTRNIGPQPTQSNNNVIFPFINKISNNKTRTPNSVYVVNILEHYRKYTLNGVLYNPRSEVFDINKRAIYSNCTTWTQLNTSSGISSTFKQIVKENLDGIMTLINNGVNVDKIELGNEFSGGVWYYSATAANTQADYNKFIAGDPINGEITEDNIWWFINSPVNITPPNFNSNTRYTLDCYADLCKMYVNIIKNYTGNPTIKFSIPFGKADHNPTWNWTFTYNNHVWNSYMLTKQSHMNINAYSLHLYYYNNSGNSVNPHNAGENSTNDDTYFQNSLGRINTYMSNNFSDTTKALGVYINKIPSTSEIWLTEWNLQSDGTPATNRIFNTFLFAYYYSEQLFALIEGNALPARKNIYRLSNHHVFNSLNGSSKPDGLFTLDYNNSGSLKKRSAYYAHKIMVPVISNDNDFKFVGLNNNAGFSNLPSNVKFRAFYKQGGACNYDVGTILLYFSNTSGADYSLDLNDYLSATLVSNPTYYIPDGLVFEDFMWSGKLYASRGLTTGNNNNNTGTAHTDADLNDPVKLADVNYTIQVTENPIPISNANFGNIVIPKYAIGYLHIPIRQPVGSITCSARLINPSLNQNNVNENEVKSINNNINIFPNPAQNKINLTVESNKESVGDISIYDLNGNLIKSLSASFNYGTTSIDIDITELASAFYVIKVINNNSTITKKFEVIK